MVEHRSRSVATGYTNSLCFCDGIAFSKDITCVDTLTHSTRSCTHTHTHTHTHIYTHTDKFAILTHEECIFNDLSHGCVRC